MPDARPLLASAPTEGTALLRANVKELLRIRHPENSHGRDLDWRPNSPGLTAAFANGDVAHFEKEELLWRLPNTRRPQTCRWVCGGTKLMTAGRTPGVNVLHEDGALAAAPSTLSVTSLEADSLGRHAWIASIDGQATMVDVDPQTGRLTKQAPIHGRYQLMRWNRTTRCLLLVTHDGELALWNIDAMTKSVVGRSKIQIRAAEWLDDDTFAVAGVSSQIHVWRCGDSQPAVTLSGHTARVQSLSVSHDRTMLVSKGLDGIVIFWHYPTFQRLCTLDECSSTHAHAIEFHPTRDLVASVDAGSGEVVVRSVELSHSLESDNRAQTATGRAVAPYAAAARVVILNPAGGSTPLGQRLLHRASSTDDGALASGRCLQHPTDDGVNEVWIWDLDVINGEVSTGYGLVEEADLVIFTCDGTNRDAVAEAGTVASKLRWLRRGAQKGRRPSLWLVGQRSAVRHASCRQLRAVAAAIGFDMFVALDTRPSSLDVLQTRIVNSVDWERAPRLLATMEFLKLRNAILQARSQALLPTRAHLQELVLRSLPLGTQRAEVGRQLDACLESLELAGEVAVMTTSDRVLLDRRFLDAHYEGLLSFISGGLNSILETRAEEGGFSVAEKYRLTSRSERRVVCLAVIERLIRRRQAVRQPGYDGDLLVFANPSTSNTTESEQTSLVATHRFAMTTFSLEHFRAVVVRLSQDPHLRRSASHSRPTFIAEGGLVFALEMNEEATEPSVMLLAPEDADEGELTSAIRLVSVMISAEASARASVTSISLRCVRCRRAQFVSVDTPQSPCELCGHRSQLLPTVDVFKRLQHQDENQRLLQEETVRGGKSTLGIFDVFISYSSKDRPWVTEWLIARLTAEGIRVCWDRGTFKIGSSIIGAIENGINRSRKVLFVLSKNWSSSEWTELEMQLTKGQDLAGKRRRALPLILDDHPMPDSLRVLVTADFRDEKDWESEFDRLLAAIRNDSDAQ